MSQKGKHTWDIIHQYHRCPECGVIFESRNDYEYCLGRYQKDLQCEKCGHLYTIIKTTSSPIGPLFGEGGPQEIQW